MPDLERIAMRKLVKEMIEFHGDEPPLFWELLAEEMKLQGLVEQIDSEDDPYAAMDYNEAREFGRKTCSFGKHVGKQYADIPYEYLAWLADSNRKLLRYVRYRAQLEPGGDDV